MIGFGTFGNVFAVFLDNIWLKILFWARLA